MATNRIYVVSARTPRVGESLSRLVRAANASQAFRHVAEDTLAVALASQDDLIDLTAAGVKVENANGDAP